jgi:hypothetical protein
MGHISKAPRCPATQDMGKGQFAKGGMGGFFILASEFYFNA